VHFSYFFYRHQNKCHYCYHHHHHHASSSVPSRCHDESFAPEAGRKRRHPSHSIDEIDDDALTYHQHPHHTMQHQPYQYHQHQHHLMYHYHQQHRQETMKLMKQLK
ncbi:MAG: hypothetical protein ACI8RD_006168, partial [Bacillariaceae sp.]|jgi:hypothetical protein